jgi:hypothetical protein
MKAQHTARKPIGVAKIEEHPLAAPVGELFEEGDPSDHRHGANQSAVWRITTGPVDSVLLRQMRRTAALSLSRAR